MASFQFEIKLAAAVFLRQSVTFDQRRIALANREQRRLFRNGKVFLILFEDTLFQS